MNHPLRRGILAALLALVAIFATSPTSAHASAPTAATDTCNAIVKCATIYNGSSWVGIGVAHYTNQYGYNAILYPGWTTNVQLGWGNVWGFWIGAGWCADVYRRQQFGLQSPVYVGRVGQNTWYYTENWYDFYVYPTSCGSW